MYVYVSCVSDRRRGDSEVTSWLVEEARLSRDACKNTGELRQQFGGEHCKYRRPGEAHQSLLAKSITSGSSSDCRSGLLADVGKPAGSMGCNVKKKNVEKQRYPSESLDSANATCNKLVMG